MTAYYCFINNKPSKRLTLLRFHVFIKILWTAIVMIHKVMTELKADALAATMFFKLFL